MSLTPADRRWLAGFILGLMLLPLAWLPARAARVTINSDAAATETLLVVMLYADIDAGDGDSLLSSGVGLHYNPGELLNPSVQQNQNLWFIGDQQRHFPYNGVDTATTGNITCILGRFAYDESPQQGVAGERVLLATITFSRATTTRPIPDPATLFQLTTALGRDPELYPDYVNFATRNGRRLDQTVTFAATRYLSGRQPAQSDDGNGYSTLQQACDNSAAGNRIRLWAAVFRGALELRRDPGCVITLQGGWDLEQRQRIAPSSTLAGRLTISGGTLVSDGLVLR